MALAAQLFCWQTLTTMVLALTVFLFLLEMSEWWRTSPRYPPGPTRIPLLGNMLQIDFQNLHGLFRQVRGPAGAGLGRGHTDSSLDGEKPPTLGACEDQQIPTLQAPSACWAAVG